MHIADNNFVKEAISVAFYFSFFFTLQVVHAQRSLLSISPFLVGLKYLASFSLTILLTVRTNGND